VKKLVIIFLTLLMLGCGQSVERISEPQRYDLASPEHSGVQLQNLGGVESFGRWTDGSPAKFMFEKSLPERFILAITIERAFAKNIGANIDVQVGNEHKSFVGKKESQRIELSFESIPNEVNTILLNIPFPQSPSSLGESGDSRMLGVAIKSIEIIPAEHKT
jgi:hypothetical protein